MTCERRVTTLPPKLQGVGNQPTLQGATAAGNTAVSVSERPVVATLQFTLFKARPPTVKFTEPIEALVGICGIIVVAKRESYNPHIVEPETEVPTLPVFTLSSDRSRS